MMMTKQPFNAFKIQNNYHFQFFIDATTIWLHKKRDKLITFEGMAICPAKQIDGL